MMPFKLREDGHWGPDGVVDIRTWISQKKQRALKLAEACQVVWSWSRVISSEAGIHLGKREEAEATVRSRYKGNVLVRRSGG